MLHDFLGELQFCVVIGEEKRFSITSFSISCLSVFTNSWTCKQKALHFQSYCFHNSRVKNLTSKFRWLFRWLSMKKYPNSSVKYPRLFKWFLCFEITALAGSYFVWNRMNHSRDFRRTVLDNFPTILEVYYKIGEQFDSCNNTRSLDSKIWDSENKSQ